MKLKIAALFTLVAIGLHYYLTNHYYELLMGMSEAESACNINDYFSCDATSASRFASLLGFPIAAWGAAASSVLFVLIVGWILRWTEDLGRLSRVTYYFAGFIALVSVGMGIISTLIIKSACPFCIIIYLCSFAVFGLLHFSLEEDQRGLMDHVKALFGPAKAYLGFFIAIPAIAFIVNSGVANKYGAAELEQYIRASIADWKTARTVTFHVEPSIVKGASDEDAKFVIHEFADFRCGHCKQAAAPLSAFVASRKDTQLRFYNFPLDNTCNEAVTGGDGVSCLLARAVTCAENVSGKGWKMHDSVFEAQSYFQASDIRKAEEKLVEFVNLHSINEEPFKACVANEEIHQQITTQAKIGKKAGVQGTPTVFVNGKKLPRGQAIPVLERAHSMIE